MLLMNALGDGDTAMSVFEQLVDRYKEPQLWVGPFVVHRTKGTDFDALVEWATARPRVGSRGSLDSLAMRYIAMSGILDRRIDPTLPDTLRRVDPGPFPRRTVSGRTRLEGAWVGPSPDFGDVVVPDNGEKEEIDSRLTTFALGLAKLDGGDVNGAFEVLDAASHEHSIREFLPYYAWASVRVDNTARIDKYLDAVFRRTPVDAVNGPAFNEYLALAMVNGGKGRVEAALDNLVRARASMPPIEDRAIFPRYQVLEAAERLYQFSNDERYREFLVETARRYAVVDPFQAWTHAFVGAYAGNARERREALARALYLDPQSLHASQAPAADRAAALKTLERGNPFVPNTDAQL
jgi:hypothetical protein